jgi:hypothetical protein
LTARRPRQLGDVPAHGAAPLYCYIIIYNNNNILLAAVDHGSWATCLLTELPRFLDVVERELAPELGRPPRYWIDVLFTNQVLEPVGPRPGAVQYGSNIGQILAKYWPNIG